MVRAIALSCCCFQIVLVLNLTTCTTASYRYFILRHGETDHNAAGIIQGSSDVSRLNKRGQGAYASDSGDELEFGPGLDLGSTGDEIARSFQKLGVMEGLPNAPSLRVPKPQYPQYKPE
jgi:hypothetical protein